MARLAAIGLGLLFIGAGALFMKWGGRLTSALNALYSRLPGRFQYPSWNHRMFGGLIVAFGVLIACVGVALAH